MTFSECQSEPFAFCHAEPFDCAQDKLREASLFSAQGKLREESRSYCTTFATPLLRRRQPERRLADVNVRAGSRSGHLAAKRHKRYSRLPEKRHERAPLVAVGMHRHVHSVVMVESHAVVRGGLPHGAHRQRVAESSQEKFFYFRGIRERPLRPAVETDQSFRFGIAAQAQWVSKNFFARQRFAESEIVFEDPLLDFEHVSARVGHLVLGGHDKRLRDLAVLVELLPSREFIEPAAELLLIGGEKLLEAFPRRFHPRDQLRLAFGSSGRPARRRRRRLRIRARG